MKDSYRNRVYELAADNAGVITIAKAEAAGVPAVELRKLTARGALERCGRGVYRVPFFPVERKNQYIEVTDMVGPDSYIGGDSVLMFLDIGVSFPKKMQVVTHARVRKSLPSFVLLDHRKGEPKFDVIHEVRCEPVYQVLKNKIGREETERIIQDIDEAFELGFINNSKHTELSGLANNFVFHEVPILTNH
jgi:hypothetical protein